MDPLKSSGRIIFLCDQIKFLTEKDDNEKKTAYVRKRKFEESD